MYKELKETEIKTATQISFEHKGLACIMLNPSNPELNGIVQETRGTLYAVADKEGLSKLHSTAKQLRNQEIKVRYETNTLDADKYYFGTQIGKDTSKQ